MSGNTVLVTGGGTGIGFAISEALIKADNRVIICGRDETKLEAARERLSALSFFVCDVSKRENRDNLFSEVKRTFPEVNILINNAGVQRETNFLLGAPELNDGESEIDINLTASIHLSALFTPYFLKADRECAIVNVTSGLAFIPLMSIPVYCASKAALHSFSISLRSQLAHTNVRVFEIIPPLVQTELHRGHQSRQSAQARGIAPDRVADKLLKALKANDYEASVGEGRDLKIASRIAPDFFHRLLNKMLKSPAR